VDLYSAFIVVPHTQGAQVRITQCYMQITPYLPSPDGTSPDWGCGHLIAAYYSFIYPKRWKAESAWLADLQWMVYPHKWSPISCRSSAGQGKFAGQRPTSYHCVYSKLLPAFSHWYVAWIVDNVSFKILRATHKKNVRDHLSLARITVPQNSSFQVTALAFTLVSSFKLSTVTFKALDSSHPPYLASLLHNYSPPQTMRSSSAKLLTVPRHNLSVGSCAFRISAPTPGTRFSSLSSKHLCVFRLNGAI